MFEDVLKTSSKHLEDVWPRKITFILFECLISLDFYFFLSVTVKEFKITKSSVVEIQNLVMNLKSRPIKLISEQLLLRHVSSNT